MKAFYRQRIPESSCARKEAVDIGILVTSRNGDRKIVKSISNEKTSLKNKEVEPGEPIQMNIYQCNTNRKDLSWLHFVTEPNFQERQQSKGRQFCTFVFATYLTVPSSN